MEELTLNTSFSHTVFFLRGFPGISQSRQALVLPFLLIYMIIVISNAGITHTICGDKTLHSPMYILISMLFAINISYTTTVVPKFLLGLMFDLNHIALTDCLVQMFFMYSTGSFESSLLLLMAFDRYVAIKIPLHYHHIVTDRTLMLLLSIGLVRSFFFTSLIVFFVSRVQFCRSNIILNFACENMSLLNLSCGDITKVQAVGLWVRILITSDGTFVLLSYLSILHTAMKITVGKASKKSRKTCSTHLLVAMLTYSCGLSSSIMSRFGSLISVDVQNLINLIQFAVPASVDPIIYGLRMKEIWTSLKKTYKMRQMGLAPLASGKREFSKAQHGKWIKTIFFLHTNQRQY